MDYITPIVRLLGLMNSKKKTRFDDLEKFNRLSPYVAGSLSIRTEDAKEIKRILGIIVDPQRAESLLRIRQKWNLSDRELANVYRHGHLKYDRTTDEYELTSEPQRSDWFYAVMLGYTLCSFAATCYAIYESPIVTGLKHPADPIFAVIVLALTAIVFAGVVILWLKMLTFYVEGRDVKKLIREILDTKAKK